MHYQTQTPSNYYQPPPQQQQTTVPSQPYYPTDAQQWSQQQTQPDLLNASSQLPSTNNSYIQPATDQSSYLQPGFTSTPNSHAIQQQQQQQSWYPSGQSDPRDRLPSNEVCKTSSPKDRRHLKKINAELSRGKVSILILMHLIAATTNGIDETSFIDHNI